MYDTYTQCRKEWQQAVVRQETRLLKHIHISDYHPVFFSWIECLNLLTLSREQTQLLNFCCGVCGSVSMVCVLRWFEVVVGLDVNLIFHFPLHFPFDFDGSEMHKKLSHFRKLLGQFGKKLKLNWLHVHFLVLFITAVSKITSQLIRYIKNSYWLKFCHFLSIHRYRHGSFVKVYNQLFRTCWKYICLRMNKYNK